MLLPEVAAGSRGNGGRQGWRRRRAARAAVGRAGGVAKAALDAADSVSIHTGCACWPLLGRHSCWALYVLLGQSVLGAGKRCECKGSVFSWRGHAAMSVCVPAGNEFCERLAYYG